MKIKMGTTQKMTDVSEVPYRSMYSRIYFEYRYLHVGRPKKTSYQSAEWIKLAQDNRQEGSPGLGGFGVGDYQPLTTNIIALPLVRCIFNHMSYYKLLKKSLEPSCIFIYGIRL